MTDVNDDSQDLNDNVATLQTGQATLQKDVTANIGDVTTNEASLESLKTKEETNTAASSKAIESNKDQMDALTKGQKFNNASITDIKTQQGYSEGSIKT